MDRGWRRPASVLHDVAPALSRPRVDARVRQGYAGNRNAGLTALRDHAGHEFVAVTSAPAPSGYHRGQSVHHKVGGRDGHGC